MLTLCLSLKKILVLRNYQVVTEKKKEKKRKEKKRATPRATQLQCPTLVACQDAVSPARCCYAPGLVAPLMGVHPAPKDVQMGAGLGLEVAQEHRMRSV